MTTLDEHFAGIRQMIDDLAERLRQTISDYDASQDELGLARASAHDLGSRLASAEEGQRRLRRRLHNAQDAIVKAGADLLACEDAKRQAELDAAALSQRASELAAQVAGLRDRLVTAELVEAMNEEEIERLNARVRELEEELNPRPKPVNFGACIHSGFMGTVYDPANYDAVFEAILASGAKTVRDRLYARKNHPQRAFFRRLRDAGIRVHATVGSSANPDEDKVALEAAMLDVADCLDTVAGWNEPEGAFAGWMAATIEHQEWLYTAVGQHWDLVHVKVAAPVLRDRNRNLGDDLARLYAGIAGFYDLANLHLYPFGETLTPEYLKSRTDMLPPNVPVVISEMGYNTGMNITTAGMPVTPDVQAQQLVDSIKVAYQQGVKDVYVYELLDDPNQSSWQSHWGIVYTPSFDPSTWTPKPALGALAELAAGK